MNRKNNDSKLVKMNNDKFLLLMYIIDGLQRNEIPIEKP